MAAFLEILKYCIPALIVFATVYFVMKKYLDQQYNLKSLEMRKDQFDKTLPLKINAYERLALFCERISVENLAYRLSNTNNTAQSLGQAMLISIQQEYEHNMSQQIYISEKLWEIIALTKVNIQAQITDAISEMNSQNTSAALINYLLNSNGDPAKMARTAIREELQLIL